MSGKGDKETECDSETKRSRDTVANRRCRRAAGYRRMVAIYLSLSSGVTTEIVRLVLRYNDLERMVAIRASGSLSSRCDPDIVSCRQEMTRLVVLAHGIPYDDRFES